MRILRVLQSQSLACGCFVGVYETYDADTVAIVEEPGSGCREQGHQPGQRVDPGALVTWRPGEGRAALPPRC
jgi:hypothetical protein